MTSTKPDRKAASHFDAPRNLGGFAEDETGVFTGIVGAPECGDVMRLQLKINDAGVIEDARFKTFGCGTATASSSYVTELLKGMNVAEADGVRSAQIAEELCLPPARIHCSVMAHDAVKAAIQDWKDRRKARNPRPDDERE